MKNEVFVDIYFTCYSMYINITSINHMDNDF